MKLSPAKQVRAGFTLLEILLASALAIVLMAALYVALDVQLRLASEGREAIEQTTVTRSIVQRLNDDLSRSIGPVAPPTGNQSSSTTSTTGTTGTTSTTGTTGTSTSTTGTTTDSTAITDGTTTSDTIPFQAGVIGSSDVLTIYAARVASVGKSTDEMSDTYPSDIRRITYWMTDKGLARQELPWVTSERLQNSTEPDFGDGKEEKDYVIAEEVTKLQFEYWDGSAWSDSWDGSELAEDGKTPIGPPLAIRVRFWLLVAGPNPGETIEKEVRHTIAVPAGPGPTTSDADATAAAQGATSGM